MLHASTPALDAFETTIIILPWSTYIMNDEWDPFEEIIVGPADLLDLELACNDNTIDNS